MSYFQSPLFLYLSYQAPHTPLQAPQNYLDMYEGVFDDPNRAALADKVIKFKVTTNKDDIPYSIYISFSRKPSSGFTPKFSDRYPLYLQTLFFFSKF